MIRLVKDNDQANNNDKFKDIEENFNIEIKKLGVDLDYLKNNFVIFDATQYNDNVITNDQVIKQSLEFLERAAILLRSVNYNRQTETIEELIASINNNNNINL